MKKRIVGNKKAHSEGRKKFGAGLNDQQQMCVDGVDQWFEYIYLERSFKHKMQDRSDC